MRFFVSALEHSADLYLADLVAALRRRRPDAHLFGLAGPAATEAGCQSLSDLTGRAAMLAHAALRGPEAIGLLSRLDRTFAYQPPDLAILLDSPTFHLPLARRLKARRIPVLYYIAPQVWAWGRFRVAKVRSRTDLLACILPFEEDFFRRQGVNAEFVGHPLMDRLRDRQPDPERLSQVSRLGRPLIALLPGSRRQVVRAVLPDMLHCVAAIRRSRPGAGFAISAARPELAGLIGHLCDRFGMELPVLHGWNAELLSRADLVLTASGTATLEVAYYAKPMVILYKASRLGYWLVGRWLIQTKHLSLVNILAGERLVPEFMPYYSSPEPIAAEALELLANEPRRRRISERLAALTRSLEKPGVADRVAAMALDLAAQRPPPRHRPLGSTSALW